MPQFNVYERNPDQFTNGFDEAYGAQIELPATNGEHVPDAISVMGDALAWVLQYCWDRRGGPPQPRTAFNRFAALSLLMRPDLVEMSTAQMARKLGLNKATLSWHGLNFSDKAGLHFRPSRRQSARREFSRVQKEIWARRRNGG